MNPSSMVTMAGIRKKLAALDAPMAFPPTKIGDKLVLEFTDPEGNDMEV